MSEEDRINLLIERLGEPNAKAWALDAARSYRKVVLGRKTHTLYRKRLIESYLQLKRFAIGKG